jgi:hypothetical protein
MSFPVLSVSKDFTDFIDEYCAYAQTQGDTAYNEENFKRYMPEAVTNTSVLAEISQPIDESAYTLDAVTLIQDSSETQGNEADYAVLMAEHDTVVSFNRAFAQRYKSKLRHFAHGGAVQKRISNPDGVLKYGITDYLTSLMGRSADNMGAGGG